MPNPLRIIYDWFYTKLPAKTAGLFRILVGLGAVASILLFGPYLKEFFSNQGYVTSYQAVKIQSSGGGGNSFSLFFWCDDLWFVQIVYIITLISGLCFILGLKPRLTAFFTWLGYLSFYNRFPAIGYGGSEVLIMLLFFSIFLESGKAYSLTSTKEKYTGDLLIEGWPLRLAQINQAMIYLFAAVTKMQGPSWRDGTELSGVINSQYAIFKYYWLAEYPGLVAFSTYASTFIELFAAYLIWFERTRLIAFVGIVLLNINIALTINVTFFPIAMIAGAAASYRPGDFYTLKRFFTSVFTMISTMTEQRLVRRFLITFLVLFISYKVIKPSLYHLSSNVCPEGYVFFEGSSLRGTDSFCAMKYEAKKDGETAVTVPYYHPWTNVNLREAKEACYNIGPGYSLLTDKQWMTIADDVSSTAINNLNINGDFLLPVGNASGSGMALGSKYVDDPRTLSCDLNKSQNSPENRYSYPFCEIKGLRTYLGCKGYCGTDSQTEHQRVLVTSHRDTIWDLSGNVWEWTDEIPAYEPRTGTGKNFYDDSEGFTGELPEPMTGSETTQFHEYTDIKNWKGLQRLKPLDSSWSSKNGIGKIYLDPGDSWGSKDEKEKEQKSFVRGGAFGNPQDSGVYALNLSHAPSNTAPYIGFRCAYNPHDPSLAAPSIRNLRSLSAALKIIITALLLLYVWREKIFFFTDKKLYLTCLLVLAAIAHVNFFKFHNRFSFHSSEFFHYYMGGKYFKELSYKRIYSCSLFADREEAAPAELDDSTKIRDLKDNTLVLQQTFDVEINDCKNYFSRDRWAEFKKDLSWFRNHYSKKEYLAFRTDHGFNPSPLWVSLWSPLLNTTSASERTFLALSIIDYVFLFLAFGLISITFGFELGTIAFSLFLTQPFSSFAWIGGSLARYDWLLFLLLGISLFYKRKTVFAALFLTLSSLIRGFPLVALIGPFLCCLENKGLLTAKPIFDLLKGIFIALAIAVLLLAASGVEISEWPLFLSHIAKHVQGEASNVLGVNAILFGFSNVSFFIFKVVLSLSLGALFYKFTQSAPIWLSSLGSLCLLILIPLSNYYLCFIPFFILTNNRAIGILACTITLLGWVADDSFRVGCNTATYWSVLIYLFFAACLSLWTVRTKLPDAPL